MRTQVIRRRGQPNNTTVLTRQGSSSVRYGAGRGGFSLARPRPYTGPGGVCFG